jgi:hypothetical protein
MPFLQDAIHKLEVGGGSRLTRVGLAVLAIVFLVVVYNWRAFRNMSTQEAMDAAQVGRNLAEGKGYSTLFVRPFSIYLVKKHNMQKGASADRSADAAMIKGMHPDLANPPVYPVFLAGLLKVANFDYAVSATSPFWSYNGRFWRYKPDFVIGLVNQMILFGVIALTFFLARKLFDRPVAWLTAGLLLGCELLWRFSVSGLSTMLLMLIFVGLAWMLVLLEEEIREPKRGAYGGVALAAGVGVVIALGCLTRYSFGWLIIPAVAYLIIFGGARRFAFVASAFAAFLVLLSPWLVRNYHLSGTLFGVQSYAVLENTMLFPENRLQRSLDPDIKIYLMPLWIKLITNLRLIVQNDLPKLGGSWLSAFFLVGFLIHFRSPAIRRLRYFLLMALGVFVIAQALGRTALTEDSPELNSENLLVLMTPFMIMYGVSLFFLLLDLIELPAVVLRYMIIGLFSALVCLPMILAFLPPKTIPVAYPPYYPPAIQTIAGWLKEKELTMSDVPWAVAWYGDRQSIWLTLKCKPDAKDISSRENFFEVNDYLKPIAILYLTPQTMDARFLSQWLRAGEQSWGLFIVESMVRKKVPDDFPLSETQNGWMPEQLMLADWQRWRKNP